MKFSDRANRAPSPSVVPLAGTWIEIYISYALRIFHKVVPLAGTWIEIPTTGKNDDVYWVVPLTGTWIEIL